jgi:glycosyltransferase involved in cell wall biosynthesis
LLQTAALLFAFCKTTLEGWGKKPEVAAMHEKELWLLLDSRDLGGIESHVLQLAAGLALAGVTPRVLFWADYGDHPLRAALDRAGIRHETLAGGFRGLVRALRRRRPIALHSHGYKAGIMGRLAARLVGRPVVSTFHAGEPGSGKLRLYILLDRLTARLGRRIAVSAAIADTLPAPVALIANFVELPDAALIAGPRDRVGFVGRLSFEKGPDLFCALAQHLPDARLTIYGDGPMRAELERDHGAAIDFRGRVVPMAPHWADIGLLVMSSRHEGLPLAALEAMAHGVPVAAFAVGGLPDLIQPGRNGFLAPAGDLDALAGMVKQWIGLPAEARAQLGQHARATIADRFSVTRGIAAVLAEYRAAGAAI